MRLLKPAVASKNRFEMRVSVRKSADSDFTSATSSESRDESNALRKLPSLIIEGGRFLLVATEYHATPALVESSKTRSDSQSFAWLPVIAAAKESFLISQWSFLEQNWVALSPISEMAALIRGRYRLRESLTQSLTSEN